MYRSGFLQMFIQAGQSTKLEKLFPRKTNKPYSKMTKWQNILNSFYLVGYVINWINIWSKIHVIYQTSVRNMSVIISTHYIIYPSCAVKIRPAFILQYILVSYVINWHLQAACIAKVTHVASHIKIYVSLRLLHF